LTTRTTEPTTAITDQRTRDEIRERYLKVETPTVCDVLEEFGHYDQGLSPSFTPYPAGDQRLAGWAYTIRGQMTPYEGPGDPDKMRAVDGLGPGDISVWSGGGGEGVCFFGELIALGMKVRGCTGALVDGGIRDVRWIGHHGFPVFARYRTPVQSIGRWKVNACQVPVYLPGATTARVEVNPGDFILADIDGAVVIPAAVALQVLERAEALTATEVLIRAELDKGATLKEVLDKYGHV
jgi:regulator of RNase E activity RraA